MRVLGVDFGRRRIGLALSDASASLARPWKTVAAGDTPAASAAQVAAVVSVLRSSSDDEFADLGAVVVGLPRRLNGTDTTETQPARAFARSLAELMQLPVHLQDERLTSVEAEEQLAGRERDWRRRKALLDAASAAIILQDYLDGCARGVVAEAVGEPHAR